MALTAQPRKRLTYANIVSTLALALALGGTGAYAAGQITGRDIKNNSVAGQDIKNGTVKSNDIKNESLRSNDIRDGSLRKKDFRAGELDLERLTAIEQINAATLQSSSFSKSISATCPDGKIAIGGGGTLTGSTGDSIAMFGGDLQPSGEAYPNRYTVTGHETAPTAAFWGVRATVICAELRFD